MFNKKAANLRSELQSPGEIKRREVELGSRSWVDCLVGELVSKTPVEIKRREVELGSRSWVDCLAAKLFLNSCFSDTVFVTASTAVERAVSGVHNLLGVGGVPTSLTLLFCR